MDQAPALNTRRQHLLEIIVADYIETAAPVASQHVARKHDLNISPATIRNDMAELEEMGYLTRPHSSAGGIPGDLAYRFYVERHSLPTRPSRQFEILVRGSLLRATANPEEWAHDAAGLLSNDVRNVGIATPPRNRHVRLKQLQLVHLQGTEVLMVAVFQGALTRQRMVTLKIEQTQEELSRVANRLNAIFGGKTTDEIKTTWDSNQVTNPIDETVVIELLSALNEEDREGHLKQYTKGLHHILNQPEFESSILAREAITTLEGGLALKRVIIESGSGQDVEVIIGEENSQETLRPYSVVLAHYGNSGEASGVIGTIGPTRMDYMKAISSVRYLATFLGELLSAINDERP